MANITKPVIEEHSCDICGGIAENREFWGVYITVLKDLDCYSECGSTRTRELSRASIDMCESCANKVVCIEEQVSDARGTIKKDTFRFRDADEHLNIKHVNQ